LAFGSCWRLNNRLDFGGVADRIAGFLTVCRTGDCIGNVGFSLLDRVGKRQLFRWRVGLVGGIEILRAVRQKPGHNNRTRDNVK